MHKDLNESSKNLAKLVSDNLLKIKLEELVNDWRTEPAPNPLTLSWLNSQVLRLFDKVKVMATELEIQKLELQKKEIESLMALAQSLTNNKADEIPNSVKKIVEQKDLLGIKPTEVRRIYDELFKTLELQAEENVRELLFSVIHFYTELASINNLEAFVLSPFSNLNRAVERLLVSIKKFLAENDDSSKIDEEQLNQVYIDLFQGNNLSLGFVTQRVFSDIIKYLAEEYFKDKTAKIESFKKEVFSSDTDEHHFEETLDGMIEVLKEEFYLPYKYLIPMLPIDERSEFELPEFQLKINLLDHSKLTFLMNQNIFEKADCELLIQYSRILKNVSSLKENCIFYWVKIKEAVVHPAYIHETNLEFTDLLIKFFEQMALFFPTRGKDEIYKFYEAFKQYIQTNNLMIDLNPADKDDKEAINEKFQHLVNCSVQIAEVTSNDALFNPIAWLVYANIDPDSEKPNNFLDMTFLLDAVTNKINSLKTWLACFFTVTDYTMSPLDKSLIINQDIALVYKCLITTLWRNDDLTDLLKLRSEQIKSQLQYTHYKRVELKEFSKPKSQYSVSESLNRLALVAGISNAKCVRLEMHAALKYKINQIIYTISPQEFELLKKITPVSATILRPDSNIESSHSESAADYLSYPDFVKLIKKAKKTKEEEKRFKQPYATLRNDFAIAYMKYHIQKNSNAKQPEKRLNPKNGDQGGHRNLLPKGKQLRAELTNKISGIAKKPFLDNSVKQLNKILSEKTKQAASLKNNAYLLNKEGRQKLQDVMYEGVCRHGYFFRPAIVESNLALFEPDKTRHDGFELYKIILKLNTEIIPYLNEKKKEILALSKGIGLDNLSTNYDNEQLLITKDQYANEPEQLVNLVEEKCNNLGVIEKPTKNILSEQLALQGFLYDCTTFASDKLNNKLMLLRLEDLRIILKKHLFNKYNTLLSSFKIPEGTVLSDDYALNRIGKFLHDCKEARKNFKYTAGDYLLVLNQQIMARKELTRTFLGACIRGRLTSEEILIKIDDEIKVLEISNKRIQGHDDGLFKTEHLAYGKILEKIALLNQLKKHFEDNEKDPLPKVVEEFKQETADLIKNQQVETNKLQQLVEETRDTMQALIYLVDHCTNKFPGRRN